MNDVRASFRPGGRASLVENPRVLGGARAFVDFARRRHVNLDALVEGLSVSADQLSNASKWVPYTVVRELLLRSRRVFGDPGIAFEIGLESVDAPSFGVFSHITRSQSNVVGAYRNMAKNIRFLTNYGSAETLQIEGQPELTMLIGYGVDPLLGDCQLTLGAAAGFTRSFGLAPAKVNELFCAVRIETLLTEEYPSGAARPRYERGLLYYKDECIGRRVLLERVDVVDSPSLAVRRAVTLEDLPRISEAGDRGPLHRWLVTPRVRDDVPSEEVDPDHPYAAVVLTRNVVVGEAPDSIVLSANRIFNASYCRWEIDLPQGPVLRAVLDGALRRWRASRQLDSDLLVQTEENARRAERISQLNVALEQRYREVERARQALLEINAHLKRQLDTRSETVDRMQSELNLSQDELQTHLAELREAESQLIHQGKMVGLGQLAAGISHELRTPIQAIVSHSSNMKKVMERIHAESERYAEQVGAIAGDEAKAAVEKVLEKSMLRTLAKHYLTIPQALETCAQQANQIIQNMREFSRTDDTARDTVPVQQLIDNTLTIARGEVIKKAEIVVDVQNELPPITCNPSHINQVLINMLTNAAHAFEDSKRGTIWVRASSPRRGIVRLEVEDDGCGMTPEVKKRIFEPFYTTKEPGKGTGLGLSISHKIICEEHRGTMDVDSEPGRGTKFTIELPLEGTRR